MGFPTKVADRALLASARCCCICHKFCGLKIELHHIKPQADGGKDTFENCIPLCFDCHGDQRSYDHRHPKGRKYSEDELKRHRTNWYGLVEKHGGRPPQGTSDDVVTLDCRLSLGADDQLIRVIGAPSVVVTFVGLSRRPARIQAVQARVKGFNPMPSLDRGFGGRLNYKPAPAKFRKNDATCVELVPLSAPTDSNGFMLDRDEIARFAFPLSSPYFSAFLEAKPNRVSLEVIFIDDTRQEFAFDDFKKQIQTLHEFYGDRQYPLHKPMQITVETVAASKPNLDAAGTVNELPIPYQEDSPGSLSQKERVVIVLQLFEYIWNHWVTTHRLQYMVRPRETVKGKTFAQIKGLTFQVGLGPVVSNLSTGELVALFRLIADQITRIRDAAGNLKDPSKQEHEGLLTLSPSDEEIAETLAKVTIADPELGPIRIRLTQLKEESS